MNERKKVKIFYGQYKYEGYLLECEDDSVYYLDDLREGKIRIPKSNSILKEVEE